MRLRRWLQIIGFAILTVLLASALWLLHSSVSFLSEAHRRNSNALAVAANGLQYWPDLLGGMAKSLLVSQNLDAISLKPKEELEGWNVAYKFWTPDLGATRITYAFDGTFKHTKGRKGKCYSLRKNIDPSENKLPFVDSPSAAAEPIFEVFGSMPLAEALFLDSTSLQPPGSTLKGDMAKVMIDRAHFKTAENPSDAELCYEASVPTEKLLSFDQTKSYFSNLLIVNGAKRVVQQIGEENLPVETLDQLQGNDQEIANTIKAQRAFAEVSDHPVPVLKKAPELAQALAPQIIEIGDRHYYAYVRPFHLPSGLRGCDAPAESDQLTNISVQQVSTSISVAESDPPKPDGQTPSTSQTPSTCYLVGLVPESKLWTDALRPTPLFEFTFALINFLMLCAFPIVRLLLLGPHESLHRHTLALIIGGAVIGLSLITLALLTWTDMTYERERMLAEAKDTASKIAAGASRDLHTLIEDGWYNHEGQLPDDAVKHKTDVNVNPKIIPLKAELNRHGEPLLASAANGLEVVEGVENIVNLASNGHPVACNVPQLSSHKWGTNRFEVTGRNYFRKFYYGEFSGHHNIPSQKNPPVRSFNNAGYVVDEVRDMTDGVNTAAVLLQAGPGELRQDLTQPEKEKKKEKETKKAKDKNKEKDKEIPDDCITTGYLITGVIGSLVSPVLTSGLEMAVVDWKVPTLPVKFDSRTERIGVEQMKYEIAPQQVQELRRWIDFNAVPASRNTPDAGTSGETPDPSFRFTAFYDGATRQFVAQLIPGTPWLVLVSYRLDDVDMLPITSTGRAFVSGLTLGFILLVGWWLLAYFLAYFRPKYVQRLWPHQKPDALNSEGHQKPDAPTSEGRLLGWFNYRIALRFLAGLGLVEVLALFFSGFVPIWLIALSSMSAVAILYVESLAAPHIAGPLAPANERTFRLLSIVFLCCVSVVPTVVVWNDARSYTVEQDRLKKAIEFNSPDSGIYRHWLALRDVARTWFTADDVAKAAGDDLAAPAGDDLETPAGDDVAKAAEKIELNKRIHVVCDAHVFVQHNFGCPKPIAGPDFYQKWFYQEWFSLIGSAYQKILPPNRTLYEQWFSPNLEPAVPPTLANDYPDCPRWDASAGDYFCITNKNFFGYSSNHDWMRLAYWRHSVQTPSTWFFVLELAFALAIMVWGGWQLLRASLLALFGFGAPLGLDFRRQRSKADPAYPLRDAFPQMESRIAASAGDLTSEGDLTSDKREAFERLVREIIPLPWEVVRDNLLCDMPESFEAVQNGISEPGHNDRLEIVITWAKRLPALSGIEALRFLQVEFKNYYRSCWNELTSSERIVLYNLANRRIINIGRAASTVASLLKKGLIVLDPAPRLMNESFAAFVREVEQRKSIQDSEEIEGLSAWSSSRLGWLIIVPVSVVSVGIVLYFAPIDLMAILPIFATGIPALISTFSNLKSPKTN